MSSGENPKNEATVTHAVVCDLVFDLDSIRLTFMSGDGEVHDLDGGDLSPLFFEVEVHPADQQELFTLLYHFADWKEEGDPIDVTVEDGNALLYNSELDFGIQLGVK